MQKKLIALALASAFAAPAFAATSNVDIYGSINLSMESVNDGAERHSRMVTNNNSFIGFKGTEDLGGGLSAVWQIEANIGVDGNGGIAAVTTSHDHACTAGSTAGSVTCDVATANTSVAAVPGSNIFGTRNTYVGLSSKSLGTVIAGVHDTPYKMSTGPLDLFVGTLGDYNAIIGSAGDVGTNSTLFDLRTANTILYTSPVFSGFDIKAAYAMGKEGAETGGNQRSSLYSLSGTYKNGPLFATLAYEKHNNVGTTVCNAGATCLNQGTDDRSAWKAGLGYTMGAFSVGAVYERMKDDAGAIDHNAWMLNGAYKMGSMTFKAEYLRAGEVDGDGGDSGANMWALGMDYAMSKRTSLQLTYARLSNDDNGGWGLGQGPRVEEDTDGDKVSGFSLGVKHTF